MKHLFLAGIFLYLSFYDVSAYPQQGPGTSTVASVRVEPTDITAQIGQELHFTAVGLDANGKVVDAPITMWFAAPWDLGSASPNGAVRPQAPGLLRVGARIGDKVGYAKVHVQPLKVSRVDLEPLAAPLVTGGHAQLAMTLRNSKGGLSEALPVKWTSTNSAILSVNGAGVVTGIQPGRASVHAEVQNVTGAVEVQVIRNPIDQLSIKPAAAVCRTGDVVHFAADTHGTSGVSLDPLPINWSVAGEEGARLWQDGAFVAERPGVYVVTANIGSRQAIASVVVSARQVARELEAVAHVIPDRLTPYSEEWIFGDTAYLATIGDKVYVYDISDPGHPKLSDQIKMDSRLINDVSTSADGQVGVLTREGASTRKNGIVFLDTSDPLHPKPISEYTQTVTGGVHSAFVEGHYAYITDDATGSLRVIDFANLKAPKEVARWQLENPIAGTTEYPLGIISSGRFLHDVFVKDGIAYLSYWRDGLVILDVGNGIKSGRPEKPALISQTHFDYHQPYGDGWNAGAHTAFRYKNYVFVGDEVLPGEYNIASRSRIPVQGIVHVLDVTDIAHPHEVATYAVPEAGAHNFWVENDLLYMGYYNGGGRVLDVSGELRGDLYRQGREVARLATGDPDGFRPNLPMAWGGQPHKGLIYFNDINSGLWIVRLGKTKLRGSTTGEPN
ncbi:MAG: Ig-like domain-containing protein [Acidobacteriota bacterium]|nr:Ig-like domain-containing protein [Acidobacteriota bacterium]